MMRTLQPPSKVDWAEACAPCAEGCLPCAEACAPAAKTSATARLKTLAMDHHSLIPFSRESESALQFYPISSSLRQRLSKPTVPEPGKWRRSQTLVFPDLLCHNAASPRPAKGLPWRRERSNPS